MKYVQCPVCGRMVEPLDSDPKMPKLHLGPDNQECKVVTCPRCQPGGNVYSAHSVACPWRSRREKLISQIEAHTGSLLSMPWSRVKTEDLQKMLEAVQIKQGGNK